MNKIHKIINIIFGIFNQVDSWEKYKKYTKIDSSVIITPDAKLNIANPDKQKKICLEIGKDSHIYSSFNILKSDAKIIIGKRCQLGGVNYVCSKEIEVGDDVIMAWGINILDTDAHSVYWEDRCKDVKRSRLAYIDTKGLDIARYHDWSKIKSEKIIIEDKVWIGVNVTVLKGVKIGEGAVVGAGSVVTKDIKPWYIVGGNPVKHLKKIRRNN